LSLSVKISKILESLGYLYPSDSESVIEFEKNFKEEIKQAKPKRWDNPLEILNPKDEDIMILKNNIIQESKGLAQAARNGKTISDNMKKKMLQDRRNASIKR